jgi:acetyltransferase-like isoleucine patch superfamily enzyme
MFRTRIGAVLRPILDAWRRVRLALWAAKVRARLRRLGMRATVEVGPGVRFHTLPLLEVDAHSPETGGGSLAIRIGEGVRLGRDLTIDVRLGGDNVLTVGPRTAIQSWCRFQLHGGSIEIGRDSHVRDLVQLKTKSALVVGDRVVLSRDVTVHATAGVTIGDDCGLGERTSVIDSDHELDGGGGAYLQAPLRADPIVLGRGVALGANCVILRGARMGDGSALAAGAVLNGDEVAAGQLAGGVPARVLKDLRG